MAIPIAVPAMSSSNGAPYCNLSWPNLWCDPITGSLVLTPLYYLLLVLYGIPWYVTLWGSSQVESMVNTLGVTLVILCTLVYLVYPGISVANLRYPMIRCDHRTLLVVPWDLWSFDPWYLWPRILVSYDPCDPGPGTGTVLWTGTGHGTGPDVTDRSVNGTVWGRVFLDGSGSDPD